MENPILLWWPLFPPDQKKKSNTHENFTLLEETEAASQVSELHQFDQDVDDVLLRKKNSLYDIQPSRYDKKQQTAMTCM